MNCIDCGKPKRSSVGERCALCSSAYVAIIRRKKLGLPPQKDVVTFSIKGLDPNTGHWEVWVGFSSLNGGQAGSKRTYWESADEIREFFYTEHIKYLDRYRFGLFRKNELIESLN